MEALRCPESQTPVAILSGGERRRVIARKRRVAEGKTDAQGEGDEEEWNERGDLRRWSSRLIGEEGVQILIHGRSSDEGGERSIERDPQRTRALIAGPQRSASASRRASARSTRAGGTPAPPVIT